MKNLVMGSASGFDWVTLEPFITSFAKHVKNADLVLFLNDISDFTLEHLKNCGKESLKIEPLFYTNLNFLGIERYENFKRYIDAHGTFGDGKNTFNDKLRAHGILAVEMESAALYLHAAAAQVQALGIFTVSDNLLTKEICTAEERQSSFNDMIKIALETIIR